MVKPTRWHLGLTTDGPPTADEILILMDKWHFALSVKAPDAPHGPPEYESYPHTDKNGSCWRTSVFITY